jgi:hypothetical protein
MKLRQSILRALLTLAFMSIFVVFILQPTISLSSYILIAIVFSLDTIAYLVSRIVSLGTPAYLPLSILLSSFLMTVFFVYVLQPASTLVIGFDLTFVIVLFIQSLSLGIAFVLGRDLPKTA